MIKGVNRRVIEINRPDSEYFERAVLYLRPEVNEVPLHAAQNAAQSYFGGQPHRHRSVRIRGWLWFLLGAAAAAAVLWGMGLLGG